MRFCPRLICWEACRWLYPPPEGVGRREATGWGDLRHILLTVVFAVVTPSRSYAATSPLKGEVEKLPPASTATASTAAGKAAARGEAGG